MPLLDREDKVRINYQVDGDGQPDFLLFNGASLPLEFWGTLATRLAETGRVIRFDQRNAGATVFKGTFTLNDVAADAAHLLATLESNRAIVIGHAWGGRVAQVFARDYPHLVQGLVICANGGQLPPIPMPEASEASRNAMKARDRDAWEKAYEALWCGEGFSQRDPERFKEIADISWNGSTNREARWDNRVSPSPSYWGTAGVKTLLIYGEEDKNGTPENARDLHGRLDDAELLMLKQAGHFVIREQEDKVLEAITRYSMQVA